MSTSHAASSDTRLSTPSVRFQLWLLIAASCFAVVALFWRTGQIAMVRWDIDPATSHAYLVPLAVAWLAWQRRERTGTRLPEQVASRSVLTGCLCVLMGILIHLYFLPALSRGAGLFPDGMGFVVTVLGLLLVIAGPVAGRLYQPAFLLLFFMVPLPLAWQQPIAETLQQTVARTSAFSLWMLGEPVFREGYILHLSDSVLEVAPGCSGLGQFVVFGGIGLFFGVYSRNVRLGTILVLLSLPVSVVANTLRIVATGLVHIHLGADWATGVLHDVEGLITVLIGIVLLFTTARLLARWTGHAADVDVQGTTHTSDSASVAEPTCETELDSQLPWSLGVHSRLAMVMTLLLPAIVVDRVIQHATADYRRPSVELNGSLAEFPTELGPWIGQDVPVQREYFLYGDDHLNRVYLNRKTGQTLTLWMVYTEDGRDRGHHPQVCMRAVGCQEMPDRTTKVSLPGPGQPAERFYFQKPASVSGEWVVYWYHVFDTGATSHGPDWLQLLAAGQPKRSGLTIQIFSPDVTASDDAGVNTFANHVEQTLQDSLLPANSRRDHLRGSYLMVNDLTAR